MSVCYETHSFELHRRQIEVVLRAWGMAVEPAATTADVLAWADLHGIDSHGISMLPTYGRQRRLGRINLFAQPEVIQATAVSALIDGGGGLGHVPAKRAMRWRSSARGMPEWRRWRCATRHISAPAVIIR